VGDVHACHDAGLCGGVDSWRAKNICLASAAEFITNIDKTVG
jgi:hypothetical protein